MIVTKEKGGYKERKEARKIDRKRWRKKERERARNKEDED